MQRTASSAGTLDGRTPLEELTGETPDITEYLDFGFYDRIWYRNNAGLGAWLGVSHRVGSLMSYWVLTLKGNVISHTIGVSRVTNLESKTDENVARCTEYDAAIAQRLKDNDYIMPEGGKPHPDDWADLAEFDMDFDKEFNQVISDESVAEADTDFTPDTYDDRYLNMELALDRGGGGGDEPEYAKVTKRLRDANGLPISTAHENPIMDTHMYEVEYQDEYKASLAANVIAQNMFSQVDEEGHRHVLWQGNQTRGRLSDYVVRCQTQERNYHRMGTPSPMERWQYQLDCFERSQGILSGTDC